MQLEERHLEEVPCNLCGASAGTVWRERFEERVGYRFQNKRCAECGLVYVSPRLKPEWRAAFNSWDVVSDRREMYEAQASYHLRTSRRRLERLESVQGRPGLILDVGCATGYFLGIARQRGWQIRGVEIDPQPAAEAQARLGPVVTVGSLTEAPYPNGQFDCVHLNDVIEHLPDPLGTLRAARRLLHPAGVLFVGTHNRAGLRARLSGDRWSDLGGLDHLYCFDATTLRRLVRQAGFQVLTMASGEVLAEGFVNRLLARLHRRELRESMETNRLWWLLQDIAGTVRTRTGLGSEIQVYARPR
jgi:SAM-dependent methyltransferase